MEPEQDAFSAKLVLLTESGSNTGVLDGEIRIHDAHMQFEAQGKQLNCPFDSVERVMMDGAPDAISQHFDRELVVQWSRKSDRWRAVTQIESGDLHDFVGRVCSRALGDPTLSVKQTVTPYSATPDDGIQRHVARTTVVIDPQTKAVTFESEEIQSVHPGAAITVQQDTHEQDQTQDEAVNIKTLSSERTIDTTLVLPDSRHVLIQDYLETALTLSETGGPIQVLLVDDEPGLTEVGKLQLTDNHDGLSIKGATSTREALGLLKQHDYECIVSDYSMPDGGAPEIIELNKKQDSPSSVIIHSRKDRDTIPEEEIPVGIDLWITKKAETEQYDRLGNTIKRLVASQGNRQKREIQ
jgi:CheY-like chemotaxis protein